MPRRWKKPGNNGEAKKFYQKVAAYDLEPNNAYQFYRGLALQALGKKNDATAVFQSMLDAVNNETDRRRHVLGGENFDPGRNFNAIKLFKRSLALEGLGKTAEAKTERAKALEMDPLAALRAFSPRRAGW